MTISQEAARQVYRNIKNKGYKKYDEEVHCTLIIRIMSDPLKATMAAFCVEAGISDSTFYRWIGKYETFRECYRYACMVSQNNWDQMGTTGIHDDMFNIEVWKTQGAARYGVGKTNRIRVHVDAETTPYDQFKQLMSQASNGDFTSSELKQLCESVNIGLRAYEVVELQNEINSLREGLTKMEAHNVDNSSAIASTKETD